MQNAKRTRLAVGVLPVGMHERRDRHADHAGELGQLAAEHGAVVVAERRGIRDDEVAGVGKRDGEARRVEAGGEQVALRAEGRRGIREDASGRPSPVAIAGWNGAPFT